MDFEHGFADVERAALAVERAAKEVLKAAKQMERAAQEGDIRKLRKATTSLGTGIETLSQEGLNAQSAWPFSEEDEQQYLKSNYASEFLSAAKAIGLVVHERDERFIAFPSIMKILVNDRAIKVDRKKVSSIRPSHLVRSLLDAQKRGPRSKSQDFLEALYAAYKLLAPKDAESPVIKLIGVYQALTLQPGSATDYGKTEFARDLFLLDGSGLSQTRSGASISLTGAPSAKGAERDRLPFVAPDGELKTYYALRFIEPKP